MTRSILRTILSALALILLVAGSLNLNRTSAASASAEEARGADICADFDCPGGPTLCAVIVMPDGTTIHCFMP